MRPAFSPHWRSAPLSWDQRAHDTEGRGVRSPEDMAADTPHKTWKGRQQTAGEEMLSHYSTNAACWMVGRLRPPSKVPFHQKLPVA